MPPRADHVPTSSLGMVPVKSRLLGHKMSLEMWLDEKREVDGAEGLWRVHDGLYDLTNFISKHPGGSDWLNMTKGHDITEAFEVHHLTDLAEETLKKYYVRDATTKRNSPFTFEEDGFFRTLKREMKPIIKSIPKLTWNTSDTICDLLVGLMFLFCTLAVTYWSYWLAVLGAVVLCWVTITGHNYFHRRDNFRMYYFQFSFLSAKNWRISHVLSHHLHTNTIDDLEISLFEPFLQYMPTKKDNLHRYGSMLMTPLLWMSYFYFSLWKRLEDIAMNGFKNTKQGDLITFTLPLAMWIFGGQSLKATLGMYFFIETVASFQFAAIGLNAAHHHPDIFHDGDTPRSTTNYDWGLSQLDAIMERKEFTRNQFLVLTNFGNHALHHFFPTVDHGALELLYPKFEEVLSRFDENLRMVSQWDTLTGGYQQLKRVEPNPEPPNLKKYTYLKEAHRKLFV